MSEVGELLTLNVQKTITTHKKCGIQIRNSGWVKDEIWARILFCFVLSRERETSQKKYRWFYTRYFNDDVGFYSWCEFITSLLGSFRGGSYVIDISSYAFFTLFFGDHESVLQRYHRKTYKNSGMRLRRYCRLRVIFHVLYVVDVNTYETCFCVFSFLNVLIWLHRCICPCQSLWRTRHASLTPWAVPGRTFLPSRDSRALRAAGPTSSFGVFCLPNLHHVACETALWRLLFHVGLARVGVTGRGKLCATHNLYRRLFPGSELGRYSLRL